MIRSILESAMDDGDLRRVGRKVDEEGRVGNTSTFFEILFEESGGFHVDTHCSEDDGEIVFVAIVNTFASAGTLDQTGLATDLCGDLVSEDSF